MPRVPEGLQRYTTEEGRFYTDGEVLLPSVTTVLNQGDEPEGIRIWKERNDGVGGRPHWRDILKYKGSRGTLIHYNILDRYAEESLYGHNEAEAIESLLTGGRHGEYKKDNAFAVETFDSIAERRGITADSVLAVEEFVANYDVGYAGQFDLLYVDTDNRLTLADIKTGKRVYPKYTKQLVAYAHAVEFPIHRLEVIRINPDRHEWEVSTSDTWSTSRDALWGEFILRRKEMTGVEEFGKRVLDAGVDDG